MDRMVWRGWHAYLINDWIDTVIMAQTIAFQFDDEKKTIDFSNWLRKSNRVNNCLPSKYWIRNTRARASSVWLPTEYNNKNAPPIVLCVCMFICWRLDLPRYAVNDEFITNSIWKQ